MTLEEQLRVLIFDPGKIGDEEYGKLQDIVDGIVMVIDLEHRLAVRALEVKEDYKWKLISVPN